MWKRWQRQVSHSLRRWRGRGGRGGKRPSRQRGRWLLPALLGVGLALVCVSCMDARLRPVLITIAQAKVTNEVTHTVDTLVSQTVAAQGLTYDQLITMEKDEQGRITALTSNMSALNALRSQLVTLAVEKIDRLDTQSLGVPLGNLTGVSLLSGHGPEVPVRVVSTGIAHGEFTNSFTEAGINQTRHQILLNLTVSVTILLPGEDVDTVITTQVPVAETVIVGAVPDTYLQMGQN